VIISIIKLLEDEEGLCLNMQCYEKYKFGCYGELGLCLVWML